MTYSYTSTAKGHYVRASCARGTHYAGPDGYWARRPEYATPYRHLTAAMAAAEAMERTERSKRRSANETNN